MVYEKKMEQVHLSKSFNRILFQNPLSTTYNRATVDCAWLQHFDTKQCGNILHQINRPLMDTNESIMERIKNDPHLYMLHKVYKLY